MLLIACVNVANLLLAPRHVRARRSSRFAPRSAPGAADSSGSCSPRASFSSVTGALAGLAIAFGLLRVILGVSPEDIPRLEQAQHRLARARVHARRGCLSAPSSSVWSRRFAPHDRSCNRPCAKAGAARSTRDRLRPVLVARRGRARDHAARRIRTRSFAARGSCSTSIRASIRAACSRRASFFPPRAIRLVAAIVRAYDGDPRRGGAHSRRAVGGACLRRAALRLVDAVVGRGRRPAQTNDKSPQANVRLASSGYFATMRIPFIAGRDIATTDNATTPGVVVVNEALARMLWPRAIPVRRSGRRSAPIGREERSQVSRSRRRRQRICTTPRLNQKPAPEFYIPYAQTPEMLWPLMQRSLVVVVRGRRRRARPKHSSRPLARAVARVDASLPLTEAKSMNRLPARARSRRRA